MEQRLAGMVLVVGALMLQACAVESVRIPLAGGREARGQIDENLDVLGVASRVAFANRDDAKTYFEESEVIQVPLGTKVIVPVVREASLGYGVLQDDRSVTDYRDNHFGLTHLQVAVQSIGAPNLQAGTQEATIKVFLWLADADKADKWFGETAYYLIFLGKRLHRRRPVSEIAAEVFVPDFPPELTTTVSDTDRNVTTVCPANETEIITAAVDTFPGRKMLIETVARVRNGAAAARTLEFRVRRGGTSCANATAIETDGHAKQTIASGGTATVAWHNSEDLAAGPVTYRVCVCTSNAAGTQTSEYVRMTFMEF